MNQYIIKQQIMDQKLVAIVRGMEEEKILPLAEALYNGGIKLIEVTFNLSTPDNYGATTRAIESIAKRFGDDMPVGAGTVVSTELVDLAYEAGSKLIVSPNTDVDVIRRTKELGLVSLPGALTPSECMVAHNAGADFIKLFPIGDLGTGYLKAIKAPLSHLHILGVGGINEKNIPDYLKAGATGFGVGGNLVNKSLVDAGEFSKITALAKAYVDAVKL